LYNFGYVATINDMKGEKKGSWAKYANQVHSYRYHGVVTKNSAGE